MGFVIDRRARARKRRGLFRATPDAREVADRLARLARRLERGAVTRAAWKKERFVVELALHPAAPPAKLIVDGDAGLRVRAATELGPGYHADVVARVARILDELEYVYEPGDDYADHGDFARLQADACGWLADELRAGATTIGVYRAFHVPGAAVLTPLGPRDAAWRDAVLADPRHAADAFAYWQRGPGHAERASALAAMWLEVPWREPIDRDERALAQRVDAELRAVRRADPDLALPWHAWAELLALTGRDDADVRARAAALATAPPPIGYRRHDLDVELSGGWIARLPGSFIGAWEDDGERYWATDGDRVVEFTSVTATGDDDSQRLVDIAPEHHPVIDRLVDGTRRGRAEAYDDDGARVVHGILADAPHVAILTCKGNITDAWALATWRSLRRATEDEAL